MKNFTVRFSKETLDKLKEEADTKNCNISEIIRDSLEGKSLLTKNILSIAETFLNKLKEEETSLDTQQLHSINTILLEVLKTI